MPFRSPIVLASASPRRQELLRNAGIEFEVHAAHIPEVPRVSENAEVFARRMAQEKARAVQALFPHRVILGADTVVTIDNEILGKPDDQQDAARMLRLLSGHTHSVITAVCLLGEGFEDIRHESTAVVFDEITDEEIRDYIGTGEPMDKAGAYAIQGGAAKWIRKVDGDYNNVVGLPVDLVWKMLRENNVLS